MADTPGSRDKALEALDFIINVLKEHEQNLDESIGELETVTEQVGKIDEINRKVEEFDQKISILQKEITSLVSIISNSPKEAFSAPVKKSESHTATTPSLSAVQGSSPMNISCKQWSDFQVLTIHAQSLSFSIKEIDKTFQVNALKNNQIIVYNGPLPMLSSILAAWLSQQLEVPKQSIIEGVLSLN
jgi:ABC-type Fe3+-citrate transport system substrate-binding protein